MDATTWIALIAAVFGGAGVKMIEKWLNRKEHSEDEATRIRKELREDLDRWKKRAEEAEESEEKWRNRYYALQEERELHNAADDNL